MIQGSDLVLGCPHCRSLARLFAVGTPECTDCISWTDGYQELPLTPAQPNISRCRHCKKLMWVARCAVIGMIDDTDPEDPEQSGWRGLHPLDPAGETDYLEALAGGMAENPEQEAELRVFAWWRCNDAYRRLQGNGRHPSSPEAVANLGQLVDLLKGGEHEFVLFRAEALRELGRFDESREALHGLCSDYALARDRIASLLDKKSRDVEVLFP